MSPQPIRPSPAGPPGSRSSAVAREATCDRARRLYIFANDNGRGCYNNWGEVRLETVQPPQPGKQA